MTFESVGQDLSARRGVWAVLRRWGLLIIAGGALAAVAAVLVSLALPKRYEATAQLFLTPASNPLLAYQDVVLGQNLARSYVQLAVAEVVLEPAMESVGWRGGIRDFREVTNVAQLRDTSIITVSFTDNDAGFAARAANAVANSFIDQSRQLQSTLQGSASNQLDEQIRSTESDIAELEKSIAALRSQLGASPKPGESPQSRGDVQAQIAQLDATRQLKQETLAQLVKTRDDARLAAARAESNVTLWQPATAPAEPVSPRPALNAVVAAFLGATVVFLLALSRSYMDDRLTDIEQVGDRLGLAPLGEVHLAPQPKSMAGKLFVRDRPTSPDAEAIRSIRTNIAFANVDDPPRIILITSAVPNEGKSVISANLALAFAEAGASTILIDADLRRSAQHRLFGIPASWGLTTLLKEGESLPGSLRPLRVATGLTVIPSGPLPPNPAQVLGSARMSHLLQQLRAGSPDTVVIIDTSPVLFVSDPLALAAHVDGCVIVSDASRTRVALTSKAAAALQRVRANVIGIVLNKLPVVDSRYSYYEYSASPLPSSDS